MDKFLQIARPVAPHGCVCATSEHDNEIFLRKQSETRVLVLIDAVALGLAWSESKCRRATPRSHRATWLAALEHTCWNVRELA